MRISDWSSDVCSSDLRRRVRASDSETALARTTYSIGTAPLTRQGVNGIYRRVALAAFELGLVSLPASELTAAVQALSTHSLRVGLTQDRSEEHTSELQSLMRHSYAVFCLKKKQSIEYTR